MVKTKTEISCIYIYKPFCCLYQQQLKKLEYINESYET